MSPEYPYDLRPMVTFSLPRAARTCALGLAVPLLASMLVACGDSADPGGAKAPAEQSADSGATKETEATEADKPPDEKAAVIDTYARHREAVLAGDGAAVAGLFTKKSVDYYDRLRELALDAEKQALKKERLMDRVYVMTMRLTFDPEVLRTGTREDIITEALRTDLITKDADRDLSVQDPKVGDGWANATYVIDGDPTSYTIPFFLEDGVWKVDVSSSMGMGSAALESTAKTMEMNHDQIVEFTVSPKGTPAEVKAAWKPIGR